MYVYRKVREGDVWLYTVGYYTPDHEAVPCWIPLEDASNEQEARALVNYLNGGNGKPFQYSK
jgi:hypothetical protein